MHEGYALITGASFGIGRALAESCGKRGMDLILVALPGEKLEETSYDLGNRYGIKTFYIETDLTRSYSTRMIYEWCKKRKLVVHTLINNAGVGYQGRFEELDTFFCENLLQLNVIALTLLTREFLPDLLRQERAHIVNVSSLSSFYPMPFKSVYAASKTYVTAFSDALHEELKHTSVTVTTVCPAGVDSSSNSSDEIDKIGWIAKLGRLRPDQVADAAISGMLKRKRRIIPGIINNLFHYATISLPSKLKAWLVHHTLRRFHKIQVHHKVATALDKSR